MRLVDYDEIAEALDSFLRLVPARDLRFQVTGVRHDGWGWLVEGELSLVGASPEPTANIDRPIGISFRVSRFGPGRS